MSFFRTLVRDEQVAAITAITNLGSTLSGTFTNVNTSMAPGATA